MWGRIGKRRTAGASSPALRAACAVLSLVFVWQVCLGVLPAQTALAEEVVTPAVETVDETLDDSTVSAPTDPESSDDSPDSVLTDDVISDVAAEDATSEPVADEVVDKEQAELDAKAEEEEVAVEAVDVLEPQDTSVSATVAVTAVDASAGTYTVTVSNIRCPSGIVKVQLPTWNSPGGQDDLKWYTATKNSNGTYSYTVAMSNHSWTAGTYNTHAYITDGNGNMTRVGMVSQQMSVPQAQITATLNASQTTATITINAPKATAVRVPVWSVDKGQDDIVWYTATKQSDGIWKVTVPLNKHKSTGTFNVHCYATMGGAQAFVGSTTFTVDKPTATVRVTSVNADKGTYTVTVSGITCPQGIAKVQMPTWVKNDQSDIKWYTATKKSDGTYAFTVPMSDHSWTSGTYRTHVYVTDGNGARTCVGGITQDMQVPQATITTTLNASQTTATISIVAPQATAVRVPVWSVDKGQDDIVWYTATKQSDGTWKVTVPLNKHKSTGTFNVHCYATMGGAQAFAGSTTFTVAKPASTVRVTAVDTVSCTYTVTVSGITCPQGIAKVQMPTWVKNDQSDIKWYTATKKSDGTYTFTVPMSDHSWTSGTYKTHVYITDANGAQTCVGGVNQSMTAPELGATVVLSSDEMAASLMAFNPDATLVKFAVWSNNNGQDDLVWYKATKRSEGIWTLSVPIAAHHDAGGYQVHCYATVGGKQTCVDRDTFTVTAPTATITVTPNANHSAVTIEVTDINSPSGVSQAQAPVWTDQYGQDDLIWHALSGNAAQGYSTSVDLGEHYFIDGSYFFQCYLTAGNGVACVAASTEQGLAPQMRGLINVISDTQLRPEYNSEAAHLADVLADLDREGYTDHIVHNGDITQHGQQSEYDLFKSIVADSSFSLSDFSVNMGNHEQRNDIHKESFEVLWARYRDNFGLSSNYRAEEIDGLRFIFLACDEVPTEGWITSLISDEQLAWLDEQLTTNEAEGYTSFVCIHHPIINTINGSLPGQWAVNSWRGLENGQEVRDVLYGHSNVVVFTSHTHFDLNGTNVFRESESTPLFIHTGAVAYSNNEDDVRGELCQGWYLYIFDDRVEFRGRDFLNDTWVPSAKCTYYF